MVRTTGPAPSFTTSDDGVPIYRPGLREAGEAPREMRMGHDSLGSMPIPADAYWGIHTARALENFPITRRALSNHPNLVIALAFVKQAAARANARRARCCTPDNKRQIASLGGRCGAR